MASAARVSLILLLVISCAIGSFRKHEISSERIALCYSGAGSKFTAYKGFYKRAAEIAKQKSYTYFSAKLFNSEKQGALVNSSKFCDRSQRWTILREIVFSQDGSQPAIEVAHFLAEVEHCKDLTCVLKLIDSVIE